VQIIIKFNWSIVIHFCCSSGLKEDIILFVTTARFIKMRLTIYLCIGVFSPSIWVKKYKVREDMTYYSLAIHFGTSLYPHWQTIPTASFFDRSVNRILSLLSQQLLSLASILFEIMSNRWREWRNKNATKRENRTAASAIIYACWKFKKTLPQAHDYLNRWTIRYWGCIKEISCCYVVS
jgi:hypothetical protein